MFWFRLVLLFDVGVGMCWGGLFSPSMMLRENHCTYDMVMSCQPS